jgi:hypothetical protein
VAHFAEESPDFNLFVPDQVRVEIFCRHLKAWIADKEQGKDTMPNFVMLRLPNDHTAGTRPGGPTPKASVADNDLAVGSGGGGDLPLAVLGRHGVFHPGRRCAGRRRSRGRASQPAVVVSKYARTRPRRAVCGQPFLLDRKRGADHGTLLGLPPMNNNDALCSLISTLFTGPGDQPAFTADYSNRDNGLIYAANAKTAAGAKESMKMDFRHADRADAKS